MTTPEPQKEQMTTQTKTETPDNGQSELERLAETLSEKCHNSKPPTSKRLILTALTTATAPLKEEIQQLREGLSLVAKNLGNGSAAAPICSIEFLTVSLPNEVKLYCHSLRAEIERLSCFETQIEAWHSQFGTSQLSHAIGERDSLKSQLTAAHAKIRELEQHLSGK